MGVITDTEFDVVLMDAYKSHVPYFSSEINKNILTITAKLHFDMLHFSRLNFILKCMK